MGRLEPSCKHKHQINCTISTLWTPREARSARWTLSGWIRRPASCGGDRHQDGGRRGPGGRCRGGEGHGSRGSDLTVVADQCRGVVQRQRESRLALPRRAIVEREPSPLCPFPTQLEEERAHLRHGGPGQRSDGGVGLSGSGWIALQQHASCLRGQPDVIERLGH